MAVTVTSHPLLASVMSLALAGSVRAQDDDVMAPISELAQVMASHAIPNPDGFVPVMTQQGLPQLSGKPNRHWLETRLPVAESARGFALLPEDLLALGFVTGAVILGVGLSGLLILGSKRSEWLQKLQQGFLWSRRGEEGILTLSTPKRKSDSKNVLVGLAAKLAQQADVIVRQRSRFGQGHVSESYVRLAVPPGLSRDDFRAVNRLADELLSKHGNLLAGVMLTDAEGRSLHVRFSQYPTAPKPASTSHLDSPLRQSRRSLTMSVAEFKSAHASHPTPPAFTSHTDEDGFSVGQTVWIKERGTDIVSGPFRIANIADDGTLQVYRKQPRQAGQILVHVGVRPENTWTLTHLRNPSRRFEAKLVGNHWAAVWSRALARVGSGALLPQKTYEKLCDTAPEQANVGNCWVVGVLRALIDLNLFDLFFRSSVQDLGWGVYRVRLPMTDENAEWVTIYPWDLWRQFNRKLGQTGEDGQLDVRHWLSPVKGGLGFRLIEAAFNKKTFGMNRRDKAEGGDPLEAMEMIFGRNALLSKGTRLWNPQGTLGEVWGYRNEAVRILDQFKPAYTLACLGTGADLAPVLDGHKLVPNHIYTLVGVVRNRFNVITHLEVVNPHRDTVIQLSFNDFITNFNYLTLSRLRPETLFWESSPAR